MPPASNNATAIWPRPAESSPRSCAASASTWAATGTSRYPALVATGTPNFRCVVGRPRRMSSSSMHGRSSCTSEYAWTVSTAAATPTAPEPSPPAERKAASTSAARTRLPGLLSAYANAWPSGAGTSVSSRRAHRSRRASVASRASVSSWAADAEATSAIQLAKTQRPIRIFEHRPYTDLGRCEPLPGRAEAGDALLEQRQSAVEIQIVGLESPHDLLQPGQLVGQRGLLSSRAPGRLAHRFTQTARRRRHPRLAR